MDFNLQTPTLLFSAISLLMLAYTNRFLTIAGLIRDLYYQHKENPSEITRTQLVNLRKRTNIIRNMQIFGGVAFFFSVLSLLFMFFAMDMSAKLTFAISLIAMLGSLLLMLIELQISVNALNIQLSEFESQLK
jgi:hypothetical protein